MTGAPLLALVVIVPIAALAASLSPRLRASMAYLVPLAPVPGLLAALFGAGTSFSFSILPVRMTFALDIPGAVLLGAAAILWIAAGLMVTTSMADENQLRRFVSWWLLTLTGSLGVFVSADLTSFYLFFSIVSLSAYGLLAQQQTAAARRAIAVYISLAVLGEAFLLMAFVLLAAASPSGSLLIRETVANLAASPWRDLTLACLILGFGLKIGLVPGHVWMPLVYTAAPLPAAAALSGAAVKSGVIGLLLFLPYGSGMAGWGTALAAAGFLAVFFGVLVGVAQTNPRTILAYSSISQMGLVAGLCGLALAHGDSAAPDAIAFYASHHVLVKGGLFVALALAATRRESEGPWLAVAVAIVALGLAGLPLTGGYVAKYVIKPVLGDGMAGALGLLASAGSALLVVHFLCCFALQPATSEAAPRGARIAWWALAAAATALPWLWATPVTGVSSSELMSVSALAVALAPIIAGGVLAVMLPRLAIAFPRRATADPARLAGWLALAARSLSRAAAKADAFVTQWPVAAIGLLLIGVVLGAFLRAGR